MRKSDTARAPLARVEFVPGTAAFSPLRLIAKKLADFRETGGALSSPFLGPYLGWGTRVFRSALFSFQKNQRFRPASLAR